MIDDRENNEHADGHEDSPPGETGKTETPYEDGLDDSAPRGMSTGVKVLIGCGVAFGGLVLIVAILVSLVAPTVLKGRGEAWKIQCTNNLKQIYFAGVAYAEKKDAFPRDKSVDEPLAHDSLNILLRSLQGRSLEPKLFKCPAGEASIAEEDEDEKFQLDEDTLDYSWTIVRRKPTGKAKVLSSDKYYKEYNDGDEHEGHEGMLQVLFTDSAVVSWEVEDEDLAGKIDEDTGLPTGLGR